MKENSKEAAKEIIGELVNRFAEQEQSYLNSAYNETQTRRDFIDPFFSALGWDMDNSQGFAEAYREVIHEDKIAVQGALKSPDYCFTVYGQKKFYVEAKRPSILIKDAPEPAFQVRRYGWSAKLPVSILTDFQEFAVYDCTSKPGEKDQAASARIKYITYRDYLNEFDYLWDHFSKEGVLKGRFDQFAKDAEKKRGTTTPDEAFLQSLDEWRLELAKNIALRNDSLGEEEINFAVQAILDRIIFLRISEDRGFEPFGSLRETQGSYAALHQLFQAADQKYNSGLFDLKKDAITPNLNIDGDVLKRIFKGLYYPAPYVFSEMPVEILGNAYEQFLGKVIRLTKGHQAKIEEKPEVRKAGGVYYTPRYIVDYIVRHAVGPLFEGKKPEDVAEIRILDPACGSGSFLLGAYEFLLEWYLNSYRDTPAYKKEHAKIRTNVVRHSTKGSPLTPDGRLTIAEKKRILLAHLHGVDIDPQAVEVTKLSLLTKMLENENGPSLKAQQELFHERVLPDLDGNIKCGNSLIGSDFYGLDFEPGTEKKIKPFDWEKEYPAVFKAGGFDAVIGNPPYLRIQGLQANYSDALHYYAEKYRSAVKRYDLYLLFLERGYSLLKANGRLSFICPHKLLNGDFASGLRNFLIERRAVASVLSFGRFLVFRNATTYTGIFLLTKSLNEAFHYYEVDAKSEDEVRSILSNPDLKSFREIQFSSLTDAPWITVDDRADGVLAKLSTQPLRLVDVMKSILVGVQTGIDEVHLLRLVEKRGSMCRVFSDREQAEIEIEIDLLKPCLTGEDVHRYESPTARYYCLYPYELVEGKTTILEENRLKSLYPQGYEYLKRHKKYLTDIRIRQKTNPIYWYSCHRSRDMNVFELDRIITPEISLGCNMTIGLSGIYHNTKVYSIVAKPERRESILYWLGLLNSPLMWFFLKQTGYVLRGGYFAFKTDYLRPFPIRTIDFDNPADKKAHDTIVKHVETMLQLHRDLQGATLPHDKEQIQRRIEHTDRQIDVLVYELYGLIEEEIRIVEGK